MVIAAWIAFTSEAETVDPRAASLLKGGWAWLDDFPCEGLRGGAFYEVANDEKSVEFLVTHTGTLLASRESWPDAPRACREISEPLNVEEVQ
ncbi:MAG: hypothetical protein EOP11_09420 [Proteobacteria bacterium]|nr:MAG: hypothetical protein EOP11_09420 [Pseudomonadota bacterium]